MTEVVIAGTGQTQVGEHWDISLRDLAFAAIQDAIKDSGGMKPRSLFVGNMLAPNLSRQAHIGVLTADFSGLEGIEAVSVEAAGASGGAALRQGYLAIASGMVDVALVLGVEKFTDKVGAAVDEALATTSDSDFEAVHGLTPTSQAALLMKRYMHEYSVPRDGFAGFALTAHANGAGNINAMFRNAIKPDTYGKAEMVSDPVNLFDAAPNADGAAAVMLVRREMLPPNFKHPLVKISGSAASTDTLALHDRKVILAFDTIQLSTNRALKQAGLSLEQIDFFEYHDTFSIYAALSLESAGFTVRGGGWKLASEGEISRQGSIPCATMGGMKARGFPGGAAGVYQAVEAVIQLQGRAGKNQIDGAQYGLIQSLGGPASTAITHVLQKLAR